MERNAIKSTETKKTGMNFNNVWFGGENFHQKITKEYDNK